MVLNIDTLDHNVLKEICSYLNLIYLNNLRCTSKFFYLNDVINTFYKNMKPYKYKHNFCIKTQNKKKCVVDKNGYSIWLSLYRRNFNIENVVLRVHFIYNNHDCNKLKVNYQDFTILNTIENIGYFNLNTNNKYNKKTIISNLVKKINIYLVKHINSYFDVETIEITFKEHKTLFNNNIDIMFLYNFFNKGIISPTSYIQSLSLNSCTLVATENYNYNVYRYLGFKKIKFN